MDNDRPFLFIPDLQIPFENKKALNFCAHIKKHYKIPDKNVICAGDETDQYYGSLYKLDPNAHLTANAEIESSIETLRQWYNVFPEMKLCISNHATRWQRKALDCSIPAILMRKYEELIQAPDGWKWAKKWYINTKTPFIAEHGDDWGGTDPHIKAALHNGISTIMGHHHSKASIKHITTSERRYWACVSGALIDFDSFAFNYARSHALKPVNGVTIIFNNGTTPLFLPLE